jgi:ArsR family transcriptional regulator, arsenate/arsenite/antimonite-responsive transcriptional repressor
MNIETFGCRTCVEIQPPAQPLEQAWVISGKLKTMDMDCAQIEKISKALADETRLRIFEAISKQENLNCGEIVSMRGVTAATVSHHLKILHEAGLIECRREGQFVHNRSVPETIEAYSRALAKLARTKKPRARSKT